MQFPLALFRGGFVVPSSDHAKGGKKNNAEVLDPSIGTSTLGSRSPITPAVALLAAQQASLAKARLLWMRASTLKQHERIYGLVTSQSYLIWMRALNQMYKKTTD